jgi:hypothetical protein
MYVLMKRASGFLFWQVGREGSQLFEEWKCEVGEGSMRQSIQKQYFSQVKKLWKFKVHISAHIHTTTVGGSNFIWLNILKGITILVLKTFGWNWLTTAPEVHGAQVLPDVWSDDELYPH